MSEPFEDFQSEIDAAMAKPVRRARVEDFSRDIERSLALAAIREAVGVTQEAFAASSHMSQENVSRIERATDVKLSTILRLAKAAGAHIELTAVMPGGERIALLRSAESTT